MTDHPDIVERLMALAERMAYVYASEHTHATVPAAAEHDALEQALSAEVTRLRVEAEALRKDAQDLAALQDFADAVFGEFPEHGDVDGFTLQELAEACGLLKEETTAAPCGGVCGCADAGVTGETQCYRVQPVMRRARIASAQRTRVAAIAATKEQQA